MPYSLSTDLEDKDIVFGGEKKLRRAVKEAYETFRPKAISDLLDLPRRASSATTCTPWPAT